MASHDLLPKGCPACGEPPLVHTEPGRTRIVCANPACPFDMVCVDAYQDGARKAKAEALAKWNTRAAETELREALKEQQQRINRLTDWLMEVAPVQISQEALDLVANDPEMIELAAALSKAGVSS